MINSLGINYLQDLSNASLTREGKVGEFDWDQNERGLLLGSYYYGYTVMQVKKSME